MNKVRFLSNRPLGKDLFDGKSQDKVATAIMQHILDVDAPLDSDNQKEDNDALPRIIGIEGSWGSGKSNTLLQLQEKLGTDYHFFTYDAWGNQEDLQRRSLLQMLTEDLVKNDKLIGETEIKQFTSAFDAFPSMQKCTWKERVDALISRKSATHNVTIPTIYNSTKLFALVIIITGILAPFLNAVKKGGGDPSPCFPIVAIGIILLPILLYCIAMCCMGSRKKKTNDKALAGWSWKEMWQMYQTTGKTDTTTYTVSELEPSVSEFRDWMTDLSNALRGNTKLVVVFDNMDRLPREKVRQLWSSIQTFFADKGYSKVWCIIPFDRVQLANAFCDAENNKDAQLANCFIEKTFPLVYRIPNPIITDYKVVFDKLFEEAFGNTEDQELINRCYRLKHPVPNIRHIISFINKLVSLTRQWDGTIKLSSCALFLLNQDLFLKSPEDGIVKGVYLNGLEALFEKNEELDTEIAALTYGVSKDDAVQLPVKNILRQAINQSTAVDLEDYSKRSAHFYSILKEVIDGMDDVLLNNAINHISGLTYDGLSESDASKLRKVWKRLADVYIYYTFEKEVDFREEVRALIENCDNKELIVEHFLTQFIREDNPHRGFEWYRVYKHVSLFSKEQGFTLQLPEKQLAGAEFLEYVRVAAEDYINFPITCANESLNSFCLEQLKEGLPVKDIITILEGNAQYDFNELTSKAKGMLEDQQATGSNFEAILSALKALSKEPMRLNVDKAFLSNLQYEGELLPDYRVLLMLADKDILDLEEKDYAAMAEVVLKYNSMQELWEKCQTANADVFAKVVRYMIENGLSDNAVTNTNDVISEMVKVVSKTGVDKGAVVRFLGAWGRKSLTEDESNLNFAIVLAQLDWIDAFEREKNDFSKAILEKFYSDCGSKPVDMFVNGNAWNATNYWAKVMGKVAKDSAFWKTAPSNASEIVKHLIDGICCRQIVENTMDEQLLDSLLSHVNFRDVSTKVHEVMNMFASTYQINVYIFLKLHGYFEKTRNQEELFLNKILRPIIEDKRVQDVVLKNPDYYEKLLKDNIDQASDLHAVLIQLHSVGINQEWLSFIERLGIIESKEGGE